MAAPIILTEKLRRPEVSGLSRDRLERPLLAAPGRGLDLIVAPPGSGKTTLLARIAALAGEPVAWYRVTADDSSEIAFVAHLATALGDAIGLGRRIDDSAGDPVTNLLAALDGARFGPCFLILDDLHEISGSAAERALERFVTLRPPTLRVLIASRRQPDINVSRLRVSGLLREITGDDLRFRSWEVEELFVGVFGEPLSPESAAALTRRTGGWAAALQLFHLATGGRSGAERAKVIADLGGRSRLIRSYLTRNVLAELPEERRTFLVRTSALGTLTGELCDALLGIVGSSQILDDLEQRQMFTTSDDDGHTFRYHEVLRSHLELALIEEYGSAGAREWYSRSAGLLEAAGELRAAVRAHARAEDWPAVARLAREWNVEAGEPPLPARMVATDPWLALVDARRLLRTGCVAAAMSAFRRAETLLDEPEFQQACRLERDLAALWAVPGDNEPVTLSAGRHWIGRLRQATRFIPADVAPTAAGSPEDLLVRGLSALLAGDLDRATALFIVLRSDGSAPGIVEFLGRAGQAVLGMLGGARGTGSESDWGPLTADADSRGLPWLGRLIRGLHEVAMMRDDPQEWRLSACSALPGECDRAGDPWGGAVLALASAVAHQLFGSVRAAAGFAEASRRFADLDAPVLGLWADALGLMSFSGPGPVALGAVGDLVSRARKRGVPGVEAFALARKRSEVEPDPELDRALGELTANCGLWASLGRLSTPPHAAGRPIPTSVPTQHDQSNRRMQLYCFAGFRMEADGVPVDLSSLRPRSCALLRLMATSPGIDLHREWLIEMLWPEADLPAGTRRLQVAISSVRQVFEHAGISGADVLPRHGDAYQLRVPPGSTVDVLEFEELLRVAQKRSKQGDLFAAIDLRDRALALYRGDLLPEDGSSDPIARVRERLRSAAAGAAAAMAADRWRADDHEGAMSAAKRAVQLDPYHDPPWRLMIELHERAGDLTAAERARREYSRVLSELGVP